MVLLVSACASPSPNSVSTIPWEERSEMDGLHQQYGLFEDDASYDGMLAPEPLSYEEF